MSEPSQLTFLPERHIMANRETVNVHTIIQGKQYCGNSIPVDIQSSDSLPNLNRTLKERKFFLQ